MDKDKFKKLQTNITRVTKINTDNLEQDIIKTLETIKILTEVYYKELRKLNKLDVEYSGQYKQKYHHYRWQSEEALTYNEIVNIYLKGDTELRTLKEDKTELEFQVEEIQKYIELLKSKQWAIKDFISWRKFLAGD